MDVNNLKDALLLIKVAVRHELGKPATFVSYAQASGRSDEALAAVLTENADILFSAVSAEFNKTDRSNPDRKEIVNAAYLYAVQPPIVKNLDKSSRKNKLRLEYLLEWLDEQYPSTESFQKRFRTWANIFATEYRKLCATQSTDAPEIAWTNRSVLASLSTQEEYDRLIKDFSKKTQADDGEEMESEHKLSPKIEMAFLKQYLSKCLLHSDEKIRRVATLYVLLRYLTLEKIDGFSDLKKAVTKNCAELSGKSQNEVVDLIEKQCNPLRERVDLALRRRAGDLPNLEYAFALSLIGEEFSPKGRYYTAISRFVDNLNDARKLLRSSGGHNYGNCS